MIHRVFYILFAVILLSCAGKQITPEQMVALDQAVTSPQIYFSPEWVIPLDNESVAVLRDLQPASGVVAGNRVFVNDGSYIRVGADSIVMNLPYFGRRQVSGSLNGDIGVKVSQKLDDWQEIKSKKIGERILKIRTQHLSETYTVFLTLFSTGRAHLNLNSTHRQSLSYEGIWR